MKECTEKRTTWGELRPNSKQSCNATCCEVLPSSIRVLKTQMEEGFVPAAECSVVFEASRSYAVSFEPLICAKAVFASSTLLGRRSFAGSLSRSWLPSVLSGNWVQASARKRLSACPYGTSLLFARYEVNPQSNPHNLSSCTTSAYLGIPRGLVSVVIATLASFTRWKS